MLVSQILSSKPSHAIETIEQGATLAQSVEVLSAKKIGALVVSDDGNSVAGIISERDIVRELGRKGAACLSEKVADVMTSTIVSCAEDETADAVLVKMTDGRFRHMPVMRDGSMVGLISIGDVVKARLSELAMEKDALEGMIMGH